MTNIDRAAEIIAQEWATFSTHDLCGHEIGIARALHRAGMLMPDDMDIQTETAAPTLPEGWRLADHKKYGRVIVTNTTPDKYGHVYVVFPAVGKITGSAWSFCFPDELTYIDTSDAVPPNTLTVGSEWNSSYALAQACVESGYDRIVVSNQYGYVFNWDKEAGWCEGSASPHFAPFTIIYTGRKADR